MNTPTTLPVHFNPGAILPKRRSPRKLSEEDAGHRILLVDDDPSVRESLASVLQSEHYTVEVASDGDEAVRRFAARHPDLVLLDLNMPRVDGWTAFEQMEQEHSFIPVIVITARPHQYSRAACAGIDAFMEKPLNLPLLLTTIRRLLNESESQRVARLTDRGFMTEDLSAEIQLS